VGESKAANSAAMTKVKKRMRRRNMAGCYEGFVEGDTDRQDGVTPCGISGLSPRLGEFDITGWVKGRVDWLHPS
jgi:hypothetical protein